VLKVSGETSALFLEFTKKANFLLQTIRRKLNRYKGFPFFVFKREKWKEKDEKCGQIFQNGRHVGDP
jgi:hypothetical protein